MGRNGREAAVGSSRRDHAVRWLDAVALSDGPEIDTLWRHPMMPSG